MSLTESIVEIAVEAARKEGAQRVTRVVVDVGALSHVEPEALEFCFAAVACGTAAEGARLEIARTLGAGPLACFARITAPLAAMMLADLGADLSAAAHLIHASSEGRFTIRWCPGELSRNEVEGVGFEYGDLKAMTARYDP